MRKGFTLMEILIVIGIISILMTITMKFGSGRIDELKWQSTKETFTNSYNQLYSQILSSNYHDGIRFENLEIQIASEANQLSYVFDSGSLQTTKAEGLLITGLTLDSGSIPHVSLQFQPYALGCIITNTENDQVHSGSQINFTILVSGKKKYCFSIKNTTCKLIEQPCN